MKKILSLVFTLLCLNAYSQIAASEEYNFPMKAGDANGKVTVA